MFLQRDYLGRAQRYHYAIKKGDIAMLPLIIIAAISLYSTALGGVESKDDPFLLIPSICGSLDTKLCMLPPQGWDTNYVLLYAY